MFDQIVGALLSSIWFTIAHMSHDYVVLIVVHHYATQIL